MSLKSILPIFVLVFLFSCQSYTPEQLDAKAQLKEQRAFLRVLEKQSDKLEGTYFDIKEDLTKIMQREGFLIRRLVREKKRYIRFSNQKVKLDKNIEDQEAREVDASTIEVNKDIGEYIQKVVDKTKVYIKELETELLERTSTGLAVRKNFEGIAAQRQEIEIKITQTQSEIFRLDKILEGE
ncbi:hypothetical protein PQO03_04715 [Lentisphaera profundi]|uniref:Lipoprotein n=1 Tax=Lentisphaera profundi TaxID=1658616 RepID=A0ABY7VVD9_9BACT|nr:hypothetical protein [Lentisphaera profundi]WDE97253.1 hypothetical protein PQO03_04715 [Lentisphaera profundi]